METLARWTIDALASMAGVFIVLGVLGVIVLVVRLMRHSPSRAFGVTARDGALVLAIAVILVLTLLTPIDSDELEPSIRLIPFQDLRDALTGVRDLGLAIGELVGNVLIFIPLGTALRWRFPSLGVMQTVGLSLAFSIGIELLQALTGNGRWPETTDVIMNATGGLIGAALIGMFSQPERQA